MSKPERYTFDDPTGYQGADFDYYDADETDKWVAELEAERERLRKALDYASNDLDVEDRVIIWGIVRGEDPHE